MREVEDGQRLGRKSIKRLLLNIRSSFCALFYQFFLMDSLLLFLLSMRTLAPKTAPSYVSSAEGGG
jgi:hypothetical protein